MKKVFLMMVMLFAMSVYSFAEDNNATEIERIERYDIKVNTKRLGEYLQLSTDQYDAVETVVDEFSNDMMFAAVECGNTTRGKVAKNAVDKNVKYMSYILNKDQYHKYLMILNATIRNRKIDIIE
jgi:hypothetical protein